MSAAVQIHSDTKRAAPATARPRVWERITERGSEFTADPDLMRKWSDEAPDRVFPLYSSSRVRGPKPRLFTHDEIATVFEMRARGETQEAVATALGCTIQRMMRNLKQSGIVSTRWQASDVTRKRMHLAASERRAQRMEIIRGIIVDNVEAIRQRVRDGQPARDIADWLGICPQFLLAHSDVVVPSAEKHKWREVRRVLFGKRHSREKFVTVDGVTRTLKEWSEVTGILPKTIGSRLRAGRSPSEAVHAPLDMTRPNAKKRAARDAAQVAA